MPSPAEPSIRLLPPDVVAKLKSSTSITHLNEVIVELVKNSLDANAHTVQVTVDVRRGSCKVEDDGDGIPPAEFESTGGLGKAHRMSFIANLRQACKCLRQLQIHQSFICLAHMVITDCSWPHWRPCLY